MPAKNHSTKYSPTKLLQACSYPASLLTKTPWNKFTEKNGFISLSRRLTLKVFYKLGKIRKLWEEFSPNISAFDLWDVRDAFLKAYRFEPYFLTIARQRGKDQEILGVLPLWFNSDKDRRDTVDFQKYAWFGSNWPEDNVFFVKGSEIIPLLLIAAPKPLELACIKPLSELDFLTSLPGFTNEEDKKFFLDLSNISTLDHFLSRLKKKKRYNLKRDRKKILSFNPKITINENFHIEDLFFLSIKRFKEQFPDEPKEHSAFEDERRKNVFRNLIANAKKYQSRLIATIINGEVAAVEFGIVYNKTYFALNSGANISKYSGIGIFSNLLVIEDALNLGCTKIDFLEGDNNWKKSWNFTHVYQYQFKK